jgi:hypothetical protein
MKLLLDEHLPHTLRLEIVSHDVYTVAYMGWSGIENGDLLSRAATAAFDAVVTNDHGFEFEQNLSILPIADVYLNVGANTIETLRAIIPELMIALNVLQPCTYMKLSH